MAAKKLSELSLMTILAQSKDVIKTLSSDAIIESAIIPKESIKENVSLIKRRFKFAGVNKTINDYEIGRVIPIFKYDLQIPPFIPVWLKSYKGKPSAIVNLTMFARGKTKEELEIDNRKLFALLQSGTIVLSLYENYSKIINSSVLQKELSKIYVKMLSKCADKNYALNISKIDYDKFSFLVSNFFLINLMEKNNDTTRDISFNNTKYGTTRATIDRTEAEFEIEYDSIIDFYKVAVPGSIDSMKSCNPKQMFETFISMYGESSMLALESLPYFLVNIFAPVVGGYINNEALLLNLAQDSINKAYNEYFRLIK
jgi:hypothetical protein